MKSIALDTESKPAFLDAVEDHEEYFILRFKGEIGTYAVERNHAKMTAVAVFLKLRI